MKDCSLSPSRAVTFGREPHDFFKLRAIESLGDGWIACRVAIGQSGLAGSYDLQIKASDFQYLERDLRRLARELDGQLGFHPVEKQIEFEIKGDGIGHFLLTGDAVFTFESGPWVKFQIEFDQTEIPGMLDELGQITTHFG